MNFSFKQSDNPRIDVSNKVLYYKDSGSHLHCPDSLTIKSYSNKGKSVGIFFNYREIKTPNELISDDFYVQMCGETGRIYNIIIYNKEGIESCLCWLKDLVRSTSKMDANKFQQHTFTYGVLKILSSYIKETYDT